MATGWDEVLEEAKDSGIPVILLDRTFDAPDDLYLTAVTSDLVHEGKVAGEWLATETDGEVCRIVELQGTTGSSPAIDRKNGFEQSIAGHDNLAIVRSQTGDFTRSLGKTVMESILKAEGGETICALNVHNDDMAVGAIQAIKEAGLAPGVDIKIVAIDGVPDAHLAIANGAMTATIELTPNMAGPALDALQAFLADGTVPPKWIQTEPKLFAAADDNAAIYDMKKDLGHQAKALRSAFGRFRWPRALSAGPSTTYSTSSFLCQHPTQPFYPRKRCPSSFREPSPSTM